MPLLQPKLHSQPEFSVEASVRVEETPPTVAEIEERRLLFNKIQRIHQESAQESAQEFGNEPLRDSRSFPTTDEMHREDGER